MEKSMSSGLNVRLAVLLVAQVVLFVSRQLELNVCLFSGTWRSPFEPIMLSTVPHYFALLFIAGCGGNIHMGYAIVIAVSSTLSLVWHGRSEPKDWTFWADYSFATLWTVYDFYLAIWHAPLSSTITVFFLNIVVLLTNKLGDWVGNQGFIDYHVAHSSWHILSSAKSTLVAFLVGCRWRGDSCAGM